MSDDFERRMQCLDFAKAMFGEGSWPSLKEVFDTAESIFAFANEKQPVLPNKEHVRWAVQGTSFPLYDYQLDIIRGVCTQKRLVINKARQMGVTTALITACAKLLQEKRDYSILFVAPRFEQAMRAVEQIQQLISAVPLVEHNKSNFGLSNGSRIIARALSADACRGLSLNLIVVDETMGRFEEAMDTFQPYIGLGTRIVVASTPTSKAFFDLMSNKNWETMLLPHYLHPRHDTNFEATMRNQLGEAAYRREFCCEFVENTD